MAIRRLPAAALLTLALAHAATGWAADPRVEAKRLVAEAEALIKKGKLAEAIERFREADTHFAVPGHSLMIARLEVKLGHLVEATEAYEKAAAYPTDRNTKPAVKAQIDKANQELGALLPRVPELTVEISGTAKALVELDGRAFEVGERMPVNPGEHEVRAEAPGMQGVTREVTLTEGEREVVKIALTPVATAGGDGDDEEEGGEGPDQGGNGARTFAYVAIGVGAASIAAGSITGALSMTRSADLAAVCGPEGASCPASEQGAIDTATALGHTSTATFAAGGAFLATGVIILLAQAGDGDDAEPDTEARRPRFVATANGGALRLRF